MKALTVALKMVGPPDEPCCECGGGEFTKHPTLNGYTCDGCGRITLGKVEVGQPVESEIEVEVERTEDGGAVLRFGKETR